MEQIVEEKIRQLAAEWIVGHHRQKTRAFTGAMNDLYGDGNQPDEMEILLISIGRADYPDDVELIRPLVQYLQETKNKHG